MWRIRAMHISGCSVAVTAVGPFLVPRFVSNFFSEITLLASIQDWQRRQDL